MVPNSSKGKEKEISEIVPKSTQYLTRDMTSKLINNAMKERRFQTFVGRRLIKAIVVKTKSPNLMWLTYL